METIKRNLDNRALRCFVFNNVFENFKKKHFFSELLDYLVRVPKALFVISSFLFLTSCSFFMRSGSQMTVRISAANYLNPDIYGRASPVVITIYQLKSRFAFEQAAYETLSANAAKTLGSDLIDRDAIEVRPAAEKKVLKALSSDSRYLGIVVEYRNIHQSVWRRIIKMTPGNRKHNVLSIYLQSQNFTAHLNHKRFYIL